MLLHFLFVQQIEENVSWVERCQCVFEGPKEFILYGKWYLKFLQKQIDRNLPKDHVNNTLEHRINFAKYN